MERENQVLARARATTLRCENEAISYAISLVGYSLTLDFEYIDKFATDPNNINELREFIKMKLSEQK